MSLPSPSEGPTLFLALCLSWGGYPSFLCPPPAVPRGSPCRCQLAVSSYRAPDVHPALPGHPTLPTLLRHLSVLTSGAPTSSPATYPLVVTKPAKPPLLHNPLHPSPCFASLPSLRLWLLLCALERSLLPHQSSSEQRQQHPQLHGDRKLPVLRLGCCLLSLQS